MSSAKTWRTNLGRLKEDDEANGGPEYFLFDPTRECLDAPIVGFRHTGRKYKPIRAAKDGSMESQQLGMRLVREGIIVRLIDSATSVRILTRPDRAKLERQRANEQAQRADEERRRADSLANEVQRLREQLLSQGKSKNGHLAGLQITIGGCRFDGLTVPISALPSNAPIVPKVRLRRSWSR